MNSTNDDGIISIENIADEINELAAEGHDFYIEVLSNGGSLKGLIFKGLYLIEGEWIFDQIDHLIYPIRFSINKNIIENVLKEIDKYIYSIETRYGRIKIFMN